MKEMLRLAASAALIFTLNSAQAQDKEERVEGNNNVVTRQVAVQPFTELEASGLYELKLTQGNTEDVRIEADENLQPYFKVRNEGSKLLIDTKDLNNKHLKVKTKMRVYVTFKKLKSLELQTVGNVTSSNDLTFDDLELSTRSVGNVNLNLSANQVNLENTSVGNVTLSGKAETAVMKNTGVGSLKAGDFVVQTLEIDNTGIGSAEVNATKGLKVQDSFLGKVRNRGEAPLRKKNKVVI